MTGKDAHVQLGFNHVCHMPTSSSWLAYIVKTCHAWLLTIMQHVHIVSMACIHQYFHNVKAQKTLAVASSEWMQLHEQQQ